VSQQIKFGSDGVRGILGHGFTRQTLRRVVSGLVRYLGEHPQDNRRLKIPIGYDARFLAPEYARYAARLLKQAGYTPLLAHSACPTPYLSFATKSQKAPVGLQLTASHNPPAYLGLKIKGAHGGSLFDSEVRKLEQCVNSADTPQLDAPFIADDKIRTFNLTKQYAKEVRKATEASKLPKTELIVDYMHGVGGGLYSETLAEYCKLVTELRKRPDPYFGGCKPEPVAGNLDELIEQVQISGSPIIGIAFDGDGDRLAVVDEKGRLLAPHELFAVFVQYAEKPESFADVVVSTVSFSRLVEKVIAANSYVISEVPVGFRHVSEDMQLKNAFLGGEQSGGTGFGQHLPERDALVMVLMLLKAKKQAKVLLADMVDEIYARYGRSVFLQRDIQLPVGTDLTAVRLRIGELANMPDLAGDEVIELGHKDGMKLKTEYGWALVRVSGTEPLVRCYVDADSAQVSERYLKAICSELGFGTKQ
jgi:phosphomannomutase